MKPSGARAMEFRRNPCLRAGFDPVLYPRGRGDLRSGRCGVGRPAHNLGAKLSLQIGCCQILLRRMPHAEDYHRIAFDREDDAVCWVLADAE